MQPNKKNNTTMKLNFIITGTGRCGTLNMAHNLTQIGIHCGHESIFNTKGTMDWPETSLLSTLQGDAWFDPSQLQADSSYMAAPFLQNFEATKIHLIRNPLQVISSFVKNLEYFQTPIKRPDQTHFEEFILHHCPSIATLSTALERACKYYLEWNRMISENDVVLHRIEDDVNVLFEKLSLPRLDKPSDQKNLFKSRDKDFELKDIPTTLRQEIAEFMEIHNY